MKEKQPRLQNWNAFFFLFFTKLAERARDRGKRRILSAGNAKLEHLDFRFVNNFGMSKHATCAPELMTHDQTRAPDLDSQQQQCDAS